MPRGWSGIAASGEIQAWLRGSNRGTCGGSPHGRRDFKPLNVRVVILALAALVLSGCYTSTRLLLDASAAAHPLEDGVYVRGGDKPDKIRVTLDPDGWYRVETYNDNGTIGETHRVLANEAELGDRDGYALAQETDDGYVYAAAFVEQGRVYLATPDCADPLDRDDAVDQGAEPQDDEAMTHNCFFKTRDALIAALSAFAGHADFGAPYQRK
jgi:hypothetical protein